MSNWDVTFSKALKQKGIEMEEDLSASWLLKFFLLPSNCLQLSGLFCSSKVGKTIPVKEETFY